MGIYDKTPSIAQDAYIAPSASVIGEVNIAASTSVWYGSVVRGDVNEITIGGMTAIQDGAVVTVNRANAAGWVPP